MSYCPRCNFEYQPGTDFCPDCGGILVDRHAGKGSAAYPLDDSWVQVCGIFSDAKAEIALGALASSNIPSTITSSVFGEPGRRRKKRCGSAGARGNLNCIMVPREFREEAEMILEALLGDDLNGMNEQR